MSAVKPVPQGFHTVTPHLVIRGAADALGFYAKALGAEERFRMPGPDGKIVHAETQIGDSIIMLGEENPQMGAFSPKHLNGSAVTLMLYVNDVDATVKTALAEGAKLVQPVEDKFYGDRAGTIEDPFGHQWHIGTHKEDVAPD